MNNVLHRAGILLLIIGSMTAPNTLGAQDTAARIAETTTRISEDADHVITGDRTIEAGEVVEDIVVVGGDLTIFGEVTGDAVVVGGDMILGETATVLGDVTVTGGEIIRNGGRVRGEMRVIDGMAANAIAGAASVAATEAMAEHAREMARNQNSDRERSWWDPIQEGIAGLISTFALGLVLAGIGAAIVFYGQSHLDTISDTLRTSTGRSVAVGLASAFLVVPFFVVMIVALAVSIVGIPFLLVAVPLYPLVVVAGGTVGLIAAAHAIGERTADQGRDRMDLRYRNSYAYLFTGLAMMLTPLLIADLLEMTGFLGFIGSLLQFVTVLVIIGATLAGFGAVILSRAGTRRTFVRTGPDPIFDDTLFDEASSPDSHV